MLTYMRTTLVLDDEVVKKAKQKSVELGTTLSSFTNEALRHALMRGRTEARADAPFRMPTYGTGAKGSVAISDLKALRDEGR